MRNVLTSTAQKLTCGLSRSLWILSAYCIGILATSCSDIQALTLSKNDANHCFMIPTTIASALPAGQYYHNYGEVSLYCGGSDAILTKLRQNAVVPSSTIEFNAGIFDTETNQITIPVDFLARETEESAIRLIQLKGPTADEWLHEIRAQRVQIIQYIPHHAYLVRADGTALRSLKKYVAQGSFLNYAETLHPWFKLDQSLADLVRKGINTELTIVVTIALAHSDAVRSAKVRVASLGMQLSGWSNLKDIEVAQISISTSKLAVLAHLPDVVAIEQWGDAEMLDGQQVQILLNSSHIDSTTLNQMSDQQSYLELLQNWGFSSEASSYPLISIVDDGIGNGGTISGAGDVTLTENASGAVSRVMGVRNCTTDVSADSAGGHGHLNASILAGYDQRYGYPYTDLNGYFRGLGVNPYARLVNIKFFRNSSGSDYSLCGGSYTGLIKTEQDTGAVISNNSWGYRYAAGAYRSDSRAYDLATRDADTEEVGNQPMIYLFAAGNEGPTTVTITSPATAKNVITVGASENIRMDDESGVWVDGCGTDAAAADNAMDISAFSSRGPVAGERIKPELVAPGTHIYGTASTSENYSGVRVCDSYRPLNTGETAQNIFAASSGTSHATPAISGIASLIYTYLQKNYEVNKPSAAMIKAYLLAYTTRLTGVSANDNIPSNTQGYGMPDLQSAFDLETERMIIDQTQIFSETGQSHHLQVNVVDATKPVRVVLAFSDAPGAINAHPVVNNLDLLVTHAGTLYHGNHLIDEYSVPGGGTDANNNYELIAFAAGVVNGALDINIQAANIAGDAIPGNTDLTDQDYALVCSNCVIVPASFMLHMTQNSVSTCAADVAENDVQISSVGGFNQPVALSAIIHNSDASAMFSEDAIYPSNRVQLAIQSQGVATGMYTVSVLGDSMTAQGNPLRQSTAFTWYHTTALDMSTPILNTPQNNTRNVSLTPTLTWQAIENAFSYQIEIALDDAFEQVVVREYVGANLTQFSPHQLNADSTYYWRVRAQNSCGMSDDSPVFTFHTAALICETIMSANVPLYLGPGIGVVNSYLNSGVDGVVRDINIMHLQGTHSNMQDLDVRLISPSGQNVQVMKRSCGNADNFSLNLDDSAQSIWPCPLTDGSTYLPSNALSVFHGQIAQGRWALRVTDNASNNGGQLDAWGLQICHEGDQAESIVATDTTISLYEDETYSGSVLDGDGTSSISTTISLVKNASHGFLDLHTDGRFTYKPDVGFCDDSDFFQYQIDNMQGTNIATVRLNIMCVSEAEEFAAIFRNGFE